MLAKLLRWFHRVFPFADPGIFVRGGGGGGGGQVSLTKKALFFSPQLMTTFFLVLSFFCRSQMVDFKENYMYHVLRFRRGSNNSQGGSNFFQGEGGGGSNCLFPIENHITCDFPGGSRPPVPPPPRSALVFSAKS